MPLPNGRLSRFVRRFVNPLMVRFGGPRSIVVLEHVGRRTGTVRRTPVMAFRHGDVVVIALTYGPDVDWLRNLRAAGGGRMLVSGRVRQLGPPRPLDPHVALARIPQPQRTLLRWPIRCRDYVEIPVLGTAQSAPAASRT